MKRLVISALALASCGDNSQDEVVADLEAQIHDLEGEVERLESELTQAEQDKATLTSERDQLAASLSALEMRVNPQITLDVPLVFGAAALELGTPYPIAGGDTISFREVRYWLTNVSLRRDDGTFVDVPDGYFLVEARGEQPLTNGTAAALTLPANRRETIALRGIPSGTYTAIRFNVGVDPARNDDLSNTAGELHTLKNMTFDNGWMWFTSYIFTKMRADLAGTGGAAVVSWDNGSNADLRQVALDFPAPLAMQGGVGYTIRVRADLESMVTAVAPRQRVLINAGTPEDRTLLADSFRGMFAMESAAATP